MLCSKFHCQKVLNRKCFPIKSSTRTSGTLNRRTRSKCSRPSRSRTPTKALGAPPETRNLSPEICYPKCFTRNLLPEIWDPKYGTRNRETQGTSPGTREPAPETRSKCSGPSRSRTQTKARGAPPETRNLLPDICLLLQIWNPTYGIRNMGPETEKLEARVPEPETQRPKRDRGALTPLARARRRRRGVRFRNLEFCTRNP